MLTLFFGSLYIYLKNKVITEMSNKLYNETNFKQTNGTNFYEDNDDFDLKCSLEAIKLIDFEQLEDKHCTDVLHLIIENETSFDFEEVEITIKLLARVYDFLIQSTQNHHECIAIVFYESISIDFYTMISIVINDVVEFLLSNKYDITFDKIVFASFNNVKILQNVLENTKFINNRFV